ncbi:MAG TPA: hypothetical protein VN256_06110 [Pyrinomonadaceae bacterium]|nr:hypothetical protein [Pyrinomonadaceae bacterium]
MGEEEKQQVLAAVKETIDLASRFTELPSVLTKIEDERGIRFAFTIEEKTGRLYCEYEPALAVAGLMEFFLKGKVRRRELNFSQEEVEKVGFTVIFCLNLMLKQLYPMMSRGLDLLFHLSVGMLHRQVIEQEKLRRIANGISPLEDVDEGFIKHTLDAFEKSTKKSFGLPTGHGGSRRKATQLKSPAELKELVLVIDQLRELWEYVTKFFEKNDYEAECIEMIKASSKFQRLSNTYPVTDAQLRKVYKRKSSRKPELEPLSLAIEHARQALNIKLKPNTVKARYLQAKKQVPIVSKKIH